MIIDYSKLINLPIASLSERKKIGEIQDLIIDKQNLLVVGFLVRISNSIFAKSKVILEADILDIDQNGMTTKSEECLIESKENIKIQKILKAKDKLINLTAFTKNNQKIGKINNFSIENNSMQVVKFFVKNWENERIFDHTNVFKITKNAIYFNDNEEKITSKLNIMQTIDE